jgi:hypothetical protein
MSHIRISDSRLLLLIPMINSPRRPDGPLAPAIERELLHFQRAYLPGSA